MSKYVKDIFGSYLTTQIGTITVSMFTKTWDVSHGYGYHVHTFRKRDGAVGYGFHKNKFRAVRLAIKNLNDPLW